VAEICGLGGYAPWDVWERMTWGDYTALTRQWAIWPPPTVSLAMLAKLSPAHRNQEKPTPDGPSQEVIDADISKLRALMDN
jgi:hypothetical protein